MPKMTDVEVLGYFIQKIEETEIGPNVTIMIGGLVAVEYWTFETILWLPVQFIWHSFLNIMICLGTCDINRRLKGNKVARIKVENVSGFVYNFGLRWLPKGGIGLRVCMAVIKLDVTVLLGILAKVHFSYLMKAFSFLPYTRTWDCR